MPSSTEISARSVPGAHHSPATTSFVASSSSAQVRFASRKSQPPFAAHAAAHDVLAVDRGEPAAHHGHELGRLLAVLREQRANAVGFLALDVDHEMVRRIGRQRRVPRVEQAGPHARQEQQHREPEAERHHLRDAVGAAACDVREPITPRDARAAAQRPDEPDERERRDIEQHGAAAKPDDRHDEHLAEADEPREQAEHGAGRGPVRHGRRHRFRRRILAQHAQRRHGAQRSASRASRTRRAPRARRRCR